MLLSRIQERGFVGNITPESITVVGKGLEQLSDTTAIDAEA